jgi:hypothetical protein
MQRGGYYRHSGIAPPFGVAASLIVGTVLAPFLGAAYGYLDKWCPSVYLNIFLTCCSAALGGWIVGKVAYRGKLRNLWFVTLIALWSGLITYYTSWISWLYALSDGQLLALFPGTIVEAAKMLAVEGVWSVKGTTPTGGWLYTCWAVEALLILGCFVATARQQIAAPFCDACQQWTGKVRPLANFHPQPDQGAELKRRLESEDYSCLDRLEQICMDDEPQHYMRFGLVNCSCGQLNLLKVETVKNSLDSKGNHEREVRTVIEHLHLNPRGLEELLTLAPS